MTDEEWLDSWTKVRRLAGHKRLVPQNNPPPLPYADSMYILRHGKKAYRTWKAATLKDHSYDKL